MSLHTSWIYFRNEKHNILELESTLKKKKKKKKKKKQKKNSGHLGGSVGLLTPDFGLSHDLTLVGSSHIGLWADSVEPAWDSLSLSLSLSLSQNKL